MEKRMMKRTLFLPLALLLTVGIFRSPPAPNRPQQKKKTGVVAELIKTDTKLGEGTEATAGHNVTVHYTGWLYNENSSRPQGQEVRQLAATATSRSIFRSAGGASSRAGIRVWQA